MRVSPKKEHTGFPFEPPTFKGGERAPKKSPPEGVNLKSSGEDSSTKGRPKDKLLEKQLKRFRPLPYYEPNSVPQNR